MLSEKIKFLKFKFACFKVKCSVTKAMKNRLKILKFCIHHANKINIPVTKGEIMAMEALLSVYDETVTELNKHMDIYRERLNHIKE
jgi:hypothetical protein